MHIIIWKIKISGRQLFYRKKAQQDRLFGQKRRTVLFESQTYWYNLSWRYRHLRDGANLCGRKIWRGTRVLTYNEHWKFFRHYEGSSGIYLLCYWLRFNWLSFKSAGRLFPVCTFPEDDEKALLYHCLHHSCMLYFRLAPTRRHRPLSIRANEQSLLYRLNRKKITKKALIRWWSTCAAVIWKRGRRGNEKYNRYAVGGAAVRYQRHYPDGRCESWRKYDISSEHSSRYEIKDGSLVLIEQNPDVNMGLTSTLSDFFVGDEMYPAEHRSLILWDSRRRHDEGYLLWWAIFLWRTHVAGAQNSVFYRIRKSNRKYDSIGFDACLMANYDTACIVKDYADYMIASGRSEPSSLGL